MAAQQKFQFRPGDITWVKLNSSAWWAAQVVDEKHAARRPKKSSKDEVLVRLYGTSDYLYVDPGKSTHEFEKMLDEEDKSPREAFLESLEQELSCLHTGDNCERQQSMAADSSAKIIGDSPEDSSNTLQMPCNMAWTGCSDLKKMKLLASRGSSQINALTAKLPPSSSSPTFGSSGTKLKELNAAELRSTDLEIRAMVKNVLLNGIMPGQNGSGKLDRVRQDDASDSRVGKKTKNDSGAVSPANVGQQRGSNYPTNSNAEHDHSALGKAKLSKQVVNQSVRRTKVMQSLGLVAPSGSPYSRVKQAMDADAEMNGRLNF